MPPKVGKDRLLPLERQLQESHNWLIRMRWLAGGSIILFTWLADRLLPFNLPELYLYLVGLSVLLYNLFFAYFRERDQDSDSLHSTSVYLQIALDWTALFLIVFMTGGIRSPATFAFTFHLIITAILLSPKACYALAAALSAGLGVLALWDGRQLIPFSVEAGWLDPAYRAVSEIYLWLFFSAFFGVTAYLATSITTRLRKKEQALFDSERTVAQSYAEMEALYELGQLVNSTLDLKRVLRLIAENAAHLLNMKACFIRLFEESGKRLYIGGSYGLSQAYINKGPVEVEKSQIDRETLRGGVVQVLEVTQDERFQYRDEARREGLHSVLCVPVSAKNRVLGVIRVYSDRPHYFSEREQNLLKNLANLGAVAIENARSYERLEQVSQERVWFARMTHHQLRSPLAAVQGSIDALSYAGDLTEKQKDLITRAKSRIQDAFELIRDLLDLAAAQRPTEEISVETVELQAELEKTLKLAEERSQDKGLDFAADFCRKPIVLRISASDLDRIVSNLLENAIKYTPPNGRVRFSAEEEGEEILLQVNDSGIGIPDDEFERIFEGFYRTSEAKASGETGTGLGLAIVQKLVSRWDGRLELESRPGEGTTFRIYFPTVSRATCQEGAVQGESRTH